MNRPTHCTHHMWPVWVGHKCLTIGCEYHDVLVTKSYDPAKRDEVCECTHPYYRHFDWAENDAPVGCKYCPCLTPILVAH